MRVHREGTIMRNTSALAQFGEAQKLNRIEPTDRQTDKQIQGENISEGWQNERENKKGKKGNKATRRD